MGGFPIHHRVTTLTALAFSAQLLLSSSSLAAARYAVVGVGVDVDPSVEGVVADVRAALPGAVADATVISASDIQGRLQAPAGAVVDMATVVGLVDAAEAAFNAVEHEKSVGILEDVIEQLEADTTFSVEKLALLQDARLRCARRLLGLAGPSETGKAETKNGVRARGHLEAALRADPTLVMDPAQTPPKLLTLLQAAAEDVKRGGHGAIAVRTVPDGATVMLEGRAMGQTPLVTAQTIAAGSYRLWVEKDGQRSFPREIEIGQATIEAQIHLGLEGSFVPAQAGLRMPVAPFDTDGVVRLVDRLGADVVVVVGKDAGDLYAGAFDKKGSLVGGLRGPALTSSEIAASVQNGGDISALPAGLYAPTSAVAGADVAAVAEDGPPWLLIGAGIAGAVVVAGGVTAAILFLGPEEKTVGITLRSAE